MASVGVWFARNCYFTGFPTGKVGWLDEMFCSGWRWEISRALTTAVKTMGPNLRMVTLVTFTWQDARFNIGRLCLYDIHITSPQHSFFMISSFLWQQLHPTYTVHLQINVSGLFQVSLSSHAPSPALALPTRMVLFLPLLAVFLGLRERQSWETKCLRICGKVGGLLLRASGCSELSLGATPCGLGDLDRSRYAWDYSHVHWRHSRILSISVPSKG